MTADLGVPAGSCAILIGVSAYEYAELPPIRAARNSLQAMRSLLSDPALCAWAPEQVAVVANPISAADLVAATARDHAAHVPRPERQDTACTSFTGGLRDLIVSGIPDSAPSLTFSDIYPVLRERLVAEGLPVPSQRGTGPASQFAFTANAAVPERPPPRGVHAESLGIRAVPLQGPEAARPEWPQHHHIVTEALRAAQSIAEGNPKARALVAVARAMACTDPDRAARLVADAQRVAQSISDAGQKAPALAAVAGPLAVSDADAAEAVARSIPEVPFKASAEAAVAEALAVNDAEGAGRLIAGAERSAQSIADPDGKASALAAVAEALAIIDPDRAEQVAQSIPTMSRKAAALAAVAEAVAAADPDRAGRLIADAERAARSIPGASGRAPALGAVARALAVTDPERAARMIVDAERSAQSIPGADRKASALAAIDPSHAERLAQSISAASWRASALAAVARALAVGDPAAPLSRSTGS